MKISRLKLAVDNAHAAIDAHFAHEIALEMGPLAVIHLMKRTAIGTSSPLADDGVKPKADEQDAVLSLIDKRRREAKKAVSACVSRDQIDAIMKEIQR